MKTKPAISVKPPKITSLEEANDFMLSLSITASKLAKTKAECDKQVAEIVEGFKPEIERCLALIEAVNKGLEDFANKNKKKLFSEERSLKLDCGVIGFRSSSSIEFGDATLALLKKYGPKEAVTIVESVNKNVLAQLSDKELAKVKANRVPSETFFTKPAVAPIGKAPAQAAKGKKGARK